MGGGIAAMHYSGMAAMRPQAMLRYDPGLVGVSVVVAVVLAAGRIARTLVASYDLIVGTGADKSQQYC